MQEKKLLDVLNREGESVELTGVNLSEGNLSQTVIDSLSKKSESRRKRLSFSSCKLGLASDATFKIILDCIRTYKFEEIGLNSNQLDKLTDENFIELLNALANNQTINTIELKDNRLNKLIMQNQAVFEHFLKTTSATTLALNGNEISDPAMSLLGSASELLSVQLDNNPLTDEGCKKLIPNPYLNQVSLFRTKTKSTTVKELKQELLINKNNLVEDRNRKFVEAVATIAQGSRQTGNVFNKLPNEMLMIIFQFMKNDFGIKKEITNLCSLILSNIRTIEPKFETMIKLGDKIIPIFKKREFISSKCPFFKAHHYKAIDKQAETTSASIPAAPSSN